MNPGLPAVDGAVVFLYFALLVTLGFVRSKRRFEDESDYLLAGRKLTLLPFTASIVSTWYGGVLGVGEFTYRHGLSNWVVFGLPYYAFAIVFAFLLASRIRLAGVTTIPDRFYSRYGRGAGILSSILVMILSSPAPYVLSVGVVVNLLFNLGPLPSLFLATFLSLVYIYYGGFRSVVRTDVLQFFLMFLGFSVMVIVAVGEYGGFSSLKAGLPPLHFTLRGSNTTQYIVVWFFIALWTLVDPGFYQRCAAARSPATAKRGILLSVLFWAIFDFLTLSTGLYARMALPDLDSPLMAIPSLGMKVLPPVLLGLFFTGILATIMSTIDSLGFISAITFGRDIIWRNRREKGNAVTWTRVGLLVTGLASLLLAWLLPSVVKLWYAIGSVAVPGLLLPFLTTFRKGNAVPGMVWMMGLPTAISLVWFLVGVGAGAETPKYPLGIEPFYPGLMVSIIWWVVAAIRRES
ncbi:MAG: sodium:solute symporter [Fidelibacterota bacterium]